MTKRGYLKEISEIKERSSGLKSHYEASMRLREIASVFEKLDNDDKELLRYIPISLVGCLEVFFRNLSKEIIDYGVPYLDNAKDLENKNFNFEAVKAIQGRYLTIGEFISHLISFNNINDIEKNISTLLGVGFLNQLKKVKAYYPWENDRPKNRFISDWNAFYKSLENTFEFRHIFCHEITKGTLVNRNEINKCLGATAKLVYATNYLMHQRLLRERDDYTQAELTEKSIDEFNKENSKLNKIKEELLSDLSEKRKIKFCNSQKTWEKFRDANAEFVSSQFEGGSIRPQIYTKKLKNMTIIRRKELEGYIEDGYL
jgi:uncharacterized protein YecT (DUF1311 family)